MRGKPRLYKRAYYPERLIPAHAGKTRLSCLSPQQQQAHPRACGENAEKTEPEWTALGSSPRMRGKHFIGDLTRIIAGLIPAHAGKTRCAFFALMTSSAHPRACGENDLAAGTLDRHEGSSPRMRGKRGRHPPTPSQTGLIPAHAGKTEAARPSAPAHSAHPRACGENAVPPKPIANEPGSSPRMRGKLSYEEFAEKILGLIPAHAGKTP